MNKVQLVGRLVADPDVKYSAGENQTCIARFRIAVDRRFKKDNEQTADFISCVSFGKTGEFIEKYFSKGMRIGLCGRIQTGSYEKDGQKVYTTDVVAEEVEFVESKGSSESAATSGTKESEDDFMAIDDGTVADLPFN